MNNDPSKFLEFVSTAQKRESYRKNSRLLLYMDGIKVLREEKGWSFKEVAEKLKEYGVETSAGTLSMAYRKHFHIRIRRRRKSSEQETPN